VLVMRVEQLTQRGGWKLGRHAAAQEDGDQTEFGGGGGQQSPCGVSAWGGVGWGGNRMNKKRDIIEIAVFLFYFLNKIF
jgi:hypothetical protein